MLIVDDNMDFLRAAEMFVGRLPGVTEVGVAMSGEDALAQVRTWPPDVVLMDLSCRAWTASRRRGGSKRLHQPRAS